MEYLKELWSVIEDRVRNPREGSYTSSLASKGVSYVARKFGEESVELIVASLRESDKRVVEEAADVVYHLMVLLAVRGIKFEDVVNELERRAKHRGGRDDSSNRELRNR